MKKKLLAVVLSVVMIAALLVPMMAISAEDAPTATVGLGEATIQAVKGVNYVVIPVNISDNTDALFTARYQVISKEGLKPFNFRNGTFVEAYEDDFGEKKEITLNISVIPDTYTDRLQIVQDAASASGTDGIKTAAGNLGAAWFTAPTEVGTYTFELVWMDGTNNKAVQYNMTVNPATVTYTVECTEHKEGEAEVVEPAKCGVAGKKVVKCTVCGKVLKEEAIPALEHDWDNGVAAEGVACGSTADVTYTCKREGCGETKVETGAKVEHNWVEDEAAYVAPKCGVAGKKVYNCSNPNCPDKTKEEAVAALEHKWDAGVPEEGKVCGETADIIHNCENGCGETKVVTGAVIEHDWVEDKEAYVAPKCGVAGKKVYVCQRANCPEKTKEEPVAALEHAYGEYKVVLLPTADAEGSMEADCQNGCGEKASKSIAKLATDVKDAGGKDNISFKSENAELPSDLTADLNSTEKDGETTLVISFSSKLFPDLDAEIEFSFDTKVDGKFENMKVYAKNDAGELVEVEFTFDNGVLTFDAAVDGEYTLVYNAVKESPDTSDATNVVVFAIAALMAVAGLIVVGKKRFAL